jgi:hypothetical protein
MDAVYLSPPGRSVESWAKASHSRCESGSARVPRKAGAAAARRWLAPPRRWCRMSRPSRVATGASVIFCRASRQPCGLRDSRACTGRAGLEQCELRIEQQLRPQLARVDKRLAVVILEALDVEHHRLQQAVSNLARGELAGDRHFHRGKAGDAYLHAGAFDHSLD